jgi:hypothetical protein
MAAAVVGCVAGCCTNAKQEKKKKGIRRFLEVTFLEDCCHSLLFRCAEWKVIFSLNYLLFLAQLKTVLLFYQFDWFWPILFIDHWAFFSVMWAYA